MFGSYGFGQGYFGQGPLSGILGAGIVESGALLTIGDDAVTSLLVGDALVFAMRVSDEVVTQLEQLEMASATLTVGDEAVTAVLVGDALATF